MNISDVFEFVGKIGFLYHQKSPDSVAINSVIAQFLGPDLYVKFCENISSYKRTDSFVPVEQSKSFSPNFLKNPVDDENSINDMDVYINFSFPSLMKALGKVLPS